jgi:hypothetical protein
MRRGGHAFGVQTIQCIHICQDLSQLLGIKIYGCIIQMESGKPCHVDDLIPSNSCDGKHLLVLSTQRHFRNGSFRNSGTPVWSPLTLNPSDLEGHPYSIRE